MKFAKPCLECGRVIEFTPVVVLSDKQNAVLFRKKRYCRQCLLAHQRATQRKQRDEARAHIESVRSGRNEGGESIAHLRPDIANASLMDRALREMNGLRPVKRGTGWHSTYWSGQATEPAVRRSDD